jgi:branched-chain amino acid transport system permease protein
MFETMEDIWEGIKDRAYYIVGILLIILIPFILQASDFPAVPILSDIYAIGRDINLFSSNTFVLRILSLCALYAIFAVSWDFLSGYTGQFNFGHAIFIGFSAYVGYWVGTGFRVVDIVIPNFFGQELIIPIGFLKELLGSIFILDPVTAMLFAAIASSLFAFVIGIIALRLKGYYLALLTLILPLIAAQMVVILFEITGGNQGISGVPLILEPVKETIACNIDCVSEQNRLNFFILTAIILLISVGIMMIIAFSRIGLAFQAIREDEDAAESLGINLTFYKVLAFVISAFFAGIAGVLFSQSSNFVGSNLFGAGTFSFRVIIMVIIGGVGSISGGVIGAFMLTILLSLYLDDVLSSVVGLEILAFGALLIISLRYLPFGIARARSEQKRAIVLGILLALSWSILPHTNFSSYLTSDSILTFISLLALLVFTLAAIPIFLISEFLGMFLLQGVFGIHIEAAVIIKAQFLIYIAVGIPYAYYLPKIFKKIRIKYWGIWPSVGQYEPE